MGLLDRCVDTLHAYFELGNTATPGDDATLISNDACSRVYDANCVTRVRAGSPATTDALLAQIEAHYAGLSHRCFKLDPVTPTSFEALLVLEGYRADVELQLLLEGTLGAVPRSVEIRPVVDERDWASLALLMRLDHEESAAKAGRECWGELVSLEMLEQKRRKAPDVQFFIATADGQSCAFFSSWPRPAGSARSRTCSPRPPFAIAASRPL